MSQNIALFLDLDNLIIGASEAGLPCDISLILNHLKEVTRGRIVLRKAYGDYRQNSQVPRQLAQAAFELQSVVRLNSSDKNLADMQLAADAIETLVNGYERFQTYVIVTGDRDFMPLVQVLRRHNKIVIGIGVRHTTNASLVELCDQYIYYDDIAPKQQKIPDDQLKAWMTKAALQAFENESRVQASLFRSHLQEVSQGSFGQSSHAKLSFGKLLERFPTIFQLEREDTTLYVCSLNANTTTTSDQHLKYRSLLKRKGLRVVSSKIRLLILRDALTLVRNAEGAPRWHQVVSVLFDHYEGTGANVSKSIINDVLRLARRADVIALPSETDAPLASLPLSLRRNGDQFVQEAIMRCDHIYMSELLADKSVVFSLEDAALALYDSAEKQAYLQQVLNYFQ